MKIIIALTLAITISLVAANDTFYSDSEVDEMFTGFIDKYYDGVHPYGSDEEFARRKSIFRDNTNHIQSVNNEKRTYTLRMNKFGDLTWDEFKAQYLMPHAPQKCSATTNSPALNTNEKLRGVQTPPVEKDWRKKGAVSPVKNQGSCGSCWTFSTTGALESAHFIKTGKMVLFSEQQLIDCAGGFNNFGCNGGLPSQAFEYVRYNGGLDTESCYPYHAVDETCKFKSSCVGVKVTGEYNITKGDEKDLMSGIARQPVSVAFEVVNDFRFYSSGVYASNDCGDKPSDVNHAVLAVGYDVGKSSAEIPYYIVKNSWGDDWGMKGFFEMEYGKNMCGIATCASYPHVADSP